MNGKGFTSDQLKLTKTYNRGKYVQLCDKQLGMVIMQWKGSKILPKLSTVMKKGTKNVQRRTGATKIDMTVLNNIMLYQMEMNGVNRAISIGLLLQDLWIFCIEK